MQKFLSGGRTWPAWSILLLIIGYQALGQSTVVFHETFDDADFWDRWHVDGGVWAVGSPTSGPGKAFAGARCAGTVLDGDYPAKADARLIRDAVFIVPAAGERPRLRFWHWFDGAPEDRPTVEIKVGTGAWQGVAPVSGWIAKNWTRALFDLSPYSGQPVQIAFHFQANGDNQVGAGWYVDEVTVETGSDSSSLINTPEGFEAGLGGWTIDHGSWEVGAPSLGPVQVYEGSQCVGTVLGGNYQPKTDSRLISPEFVVPAASEHPRLRFWHWFSVWPGDRAQVEISLSGGPWQSLSREYGINGAVWTRPWLDLSAYSGQSAQIAFHLQADEDPNVALGWYVDEVVVETGPEDWDAVREPASFESGLGNWSVDNGTWEAGRPVSGATNAVSGSRCVGTVLGGKYPGQVNTRLISPVFTVPEALDQPRLRFWQWLRTGAGDFGTVEIRVAGQDWQKLLGPVAGRDGTWARPYVGLEGYEGQRVQVAFHFESDEDGQEDAGWFIDDVTVDIGPLRLDLLGGAGEGFENGLGDWSVDTGSWQVVHPNSYPETAHSGTSCMGPAQVDNYVPGVDGRLISPAFVVPGGASNPRLRFWHWFSTWPGDYGVVEVSVGGGPWQGVLAPYTLNGVVWTRGWLDLKAFAGQSIRVAFHFHSDTDENVARGWYIDDVVLETGPSELQSFNTAEGFEGGLGNWWVENGTWEVGTPGSGPGLAFKGTNCAATVLRFGSGMYVPKTDSRLVSPVLTVPCAEAGPRLRFAQWYDIAEGDGGTVEIRAGEGAWQTVLGPVSGQSRDWTTGFYDLTAYAGQRIQIAFRFQSNADAQVSSGWYVDEVLFEATPFQAIDKISGVEGTFITASFGSPCQNLRFGLGPGAPAGAQLDPALGIFYWLPSEDQGPGVYPIQICVVDPTNPFASSFCLPFEVTVLETNSVPILNPIENRVISPGVPLQIAVSASDTDLPKQTLSYSLEGAPFGATIDPATGFFTWTPTPTEATSDYTITVRVTDDGNPPLSAITSFRVAPSGPAFGVRLEVTRLTPELVTLCMRGGALNALYYLQSTTDLDSTGSAVNWTLLRAIVKGADDYCEVTHSISSVRRFYRIEQAP